MEKGVFVSVVGTQITGTLQPWLSAVASQGPCVAHLYSTPQTRTHAAQLKEYAETHGMGEAHLHQLPEVRVDPKAAPRMIAELAEQLASQGQRIWFNSLGGIKFLNSDIYLALFPFRPLIIIGSHGKTLLFDSDNNSVTILSPAPSLPVEELLNLQQVPWRHAAPPAGHPDTDSIFEVARNSNIPLPANQLRNAQINGRFFDLVWNPGHNTLCLCVDRRNHKHQCPELEQTARAEWMKNEDRELAAFLQDKPSWLSLSDKEVYIIVDNPKSRARFEEYNKIHVHREKMAYNTNSSTLPKTLARWFMPALFNEIDPKLSSGSVNAITDYKDDTLIVVLGTNLHPTLIAILTHKPKNLILCYTPGNIAISQIINNLRKYKNIFGLESITPLAISLEGEFIHKVLSAPGESCANLSLNISPGTKSQGIMLTHWAARHGVAVWSLENRNARATMLGPTPDQPPAPANNPTPYHLLKISGADVWEDRMKTVEQVNKKEVYKELLQFLRDVVAAGLADKAFNEAVEVGGRRLGVLSGTYLKFKDKTGVIHRFPVRGGQWFEELCAVAFREAKGEDIYLNISKRWPKPMEENFKRQTGDDPHAIEWDVVGYYHRTLVLISCKSNPKTPPKKMAKDIKDVNSSAAILGNFTLRVLAHMTCKQPIMHQDKILIIGWKELCQPEVLQKELSRLKNKQSTTSGAFDE